jgi:hypothetical protein
MNYQLEAQRTRPDFTVYIPKSIGESCVDGGNEHFLVEPLPGVPGGLFAIWTQSSFEGNPDQRIVFAKSTDGGKTWIEPTTVAGPKPPDLGMASWGFPLVSRSGRIYVIYSRHTGVNDVFTHTTAIMGCVCSDDCGATWSPEAILPMPRSCWDNPDPAIPPNWIVWQKPLRLPGGKYFTGFTHWVSPAVRPKAPRPEWWAEAAVVEFIRFENIDDNPAPKDVAITYLTPDKKALQVGLIGHPDVPAIQEPSWVPLPDGRLFAVMRSTRGYPVYAVSADNGETWSQPEPLRRYDDGPVMPHPCSPCPIYALDAKNFILFYHNHDGNFMGYTPAQTMLHRRPVCLARGEFRPEARQPVWFSEPWCFMDTGGVPMLRADMAMYASTTRDNDDLIIWYPDRKFFLLGKRVPREMVLNMATPK